MSDQFYRAFEEKFRGSRALIQQRLEVYLPFVQPVCAAYPEALVLDLGCGRGEWLELLQKNAISAMGVDLDAGMLEACQKLNLKVQSQDALEFLKQLQDGSASVISAFHLVEHLPFDHVKDLVAECHRVLKPGGLLIMETPNPENFMVATQSFYLDPTHVRPIPPDLLAFVPEFVGYESVKVLRLQEPADVKSHPNLSMLDVLTGASPDYAVVAQKLGYTALKNSLQALFDQAFGISGYALLERHRQQANDFSFKLEKSISKHEKSISKLEKSISKTEILFAQIKTQLDRVELQLQISPSGTYKGVIGSLFLQFLRVAEQGLWTRVVALGSKLLRLLARLSLKFVNSRPILKMRLIEASLKLGIAPVLRKLWGRLQNKGLENGDKETQSAITAESMSQSAQRIAQTLQNKKKM
jgi:O-antigen chain-terminating methyltransferase